MMRADRYIITDCREQAELFRVILVFLLKNLKYFVAKLK